MSKQTVIFLSRKITLNRSDAAGVALPAVELAAGRNVVDVDVAEHPFVKHHTYEASASADAGELEALRVRISELEEQLTASASAGGGKAIEKVREKLADAEKARDGLRADLTASQARIVELVDQLAAKDADMAALVASIPKPADAAKA